MYQHQPQSSGMSTKHKVFVGLGAGLGVAGLMVTSFAVGVAVVKPESFDTSEETEASPSPSASATEEPVQEETPEPVEEAVEGVDIESFVGASAESGAFDVEVVEAYHATTLSDGFGWSETAPDDMQYSVFYVAVTNTGSSPEWYDNESRSETDAGNTYSSSGDAEIAAYDIDSDFWFDELNPNTTGYTYHVFAVPKDETVTSVELYEGGVLTPVE